VKLRKTLLLYKRHTEACSVHETRVPESRKRFWMECDCLIWIVGRTPAGDVVPRQSTGCTTLREAEAVQTSLLAESRRKDGASIEACIEKYLASRQHELAEKTYGQHELLLGRLKTFAESRGAVLMNDLTVDLLETFKVEGLPGLADTSKGTAVAKLRCFLRTAYRRGWIGEPLVEKVTPHRAVYEQKEPYTDAQVKLILDESLKLNGGTHGYAKHPKTFRLLLELMLETGMRVGDAIRFDPAALVKGKCLWVYSFVPQKSKRTEQPKLIEAYISDRLKTAIDACVWLSPNRPFAFGSSTNAAYLASEVYYRMQTIGERCGVTDCRPHRMRDTFAVRKLLSGFQLDDVSRLLGHSSVKITELYYAKWTRTRKDRLETLVAESLMNA
jgi:integrase/recombinase XerD